MRYSLPALPYEFDELEPYISAKTFHFHYGKHHQAYLDNLNKLVVKTDFDGMTLEGIIQNASGSIFNNASQSWNHAFYWESMKPQGGGMPSGKIETLIDDSFGGYDEFVKEFKAAGITQFGSGWVWLVLDRGKLEIIKTLNAKNPITENKKPLIVCDVWEHAYYLDYQNRRSDYLQIFLDHLINWNFANSNISE
jgi:Fe-Mn family superoxide dismutase